MMTNLETTEESAEQSVPEGRAGYSYGLLDEGAKKEIRRSCLKALALPGYQVPFASREMPIARGFGTGGLQITLSLLGDTDTLKVIDQGADASVNAESLKELVKKVCPGTQTTEDTHAATVIQTRHRIPETVMQEGQIIVFQVPYPDPLGGIEPSEVVRVQMHGEADYARMFVRLYEDVVRAGRITQGASYPMQINGHYIMTPSPIPRWDVLRLNDSKCINLFGAGREKKIHAVPPYTPAVPLQFEDVRFRVEQFQNEDGSRRVCAKCGDDNTFLDEVYLSDGTKTFMCSDTEHCERRERRQGA